MFSKVSRKVFPVAAATLLWAGSLAQMAEAKECTTDADCDSGYQCSSANIDIGQTTVATPPGGGSSSGAGAATGTACTGDKCASVETPPSLPVDAGVAIPVTPIKGTCQLKPVVCTSVADCPTADFDCVKVTAPSPACAPDTKCDTPPSQTSDTGICYAKVRACSVATDCPAPLTCQSQATTCTGGASVSTDGTVTSTPTTCTPGPTVCTWVAVACAADSDCADPLYACAKVRESTGCSATGPCLAVGDASARCAPSEPPTCVTSVEKDCMPKPIDCGAGQACPAGWSCFDFSNYNGGVRPVWSPSAPDKSCLPDGIILATQGHVAGAGQLTASSGTKGGDLAGAFPSVDGGVAPTGGTGTGTGSTTDISTGVNPGQGGSSNPPVVSPGPSNEGALSADAGSAKPVATQGGGCNLGGGNGGFLSLGLGLALSVLAARRSRRR